MTFKSRVVRAVSVAAVLTSTAIVLPGGATAAAGGFCSVSYPGTTITWTGGATGAHKHDWDDPDNWDPATVPDENQDSTTYQAQYVCIGGGASVTVAPGDNFHVAGLDVGEGAQLVIGLKGGIFLGADDTADLVPSYVENGDNLSLDGATLGGNATINVAGTLDWAGQLDGQHRLAATQAGTGTTVIGSSGTLLVDGAKFGGAVVADSRTIDNSGSLIISKTGFISMVDGTSLIDEAGSSLELQGEGGIYPNQPDAKASIKQEGSVTKTGAGLAVIGVPVSLKKSVKPVIKSGGLSFATNAVPKVNLPRNTSYGVGSCDATDRKLCHTTAATKPVPQSAIVTTSTEAPAKSAVRVALTGAPKQIDGNTSIGKSVTVTAPTERTTHSTHLFFKYDASMKGVGAAIEPVYRGKGKITVCKVQGLTAENTSCVLSQKIVKGDLEIIVISIQPNATWTVA
jgi:hypothetical protein